MEYLFGVVILLGVLIFFHEFGHFLVSKFFGIKVEAFSIGFGPKIIKKKIGETTYCLSLIPLGGYVKLFGEDSLTPIKGPDSKRAFSNQNVWKRILVAGAGPGFNLLLAVIVFFVIAVCGLEKIIVPKLTDILPNSQAWNAGLRSGDELLSINGKKINRYDEFLAEVAAYPKHPHEQKLTVQRQGQPVDILFTPLVKENWNMFCEKEPQGTLDGIVMAAATPVVGFTDPNSWAAKMSFKNGDQVLSLNGVHVTYWKDLKEYLLNIAQHELTFIVDREGKEMTIAATLPPEYFLLTHDQKERYLGLYSYDFFVKDAFPETSAGHRAGLQVGDRFVAMNDKPILDWEQFRNGVQTYGKDPGHFYLTYERNGQLNRVQLSPVKTIAPHPCGVDEEFYQIGIMIKSDLQPPQMKRYFVLNPVKALYYSVEKSAMLTVLVFKSVLKIFQGTVPLKAVGGPVLIGKIAGDQLKQGLYQFLALLAMISINLAVLNILPIPILDGGHLFFFFCEVVRGKPLSNKVLEFANRAGLAVILSLLVLVFYNDISRYWTGIVGTLKKIVGMA